MQERLTEVLHQAGLAHVRRAVETPFNMILEARRRDDAGLRSTRA